MIPADCQNEKKGIFIFERVIKRRGQGIGDGIVRRDNPSFQMFGVGFKDEKRSFFMRFKLSMPQPLAHGDMPGFLDAYSSE